jgi:hypothetical protein
VPDSIPLISLRRGLRGTGNCRACVRSGSEPLEPKVCRGGRPRALFTPLAQSFATASGLSLFTVLMIQGIGFATPVLPYQASPIVVVMGMGKIPFAGGAAFEPSSGRDHLP